MGKVRVMVRVKSMGKESMRMGTGKGEGEYGPYGDGSGEHGDGKVKTR